MSKSATMTTHVVDNRALYERLDQVRLDADVSWRQVGRDTGLPPTTFTRLSKGQGLSANALVTLLVWLEMNEGISSFVEGISSFIEEAS